MKEISFKCDCCKERTDVQPLCIPVRSYVDAAGSRDTEDVNFELCVGCMGRFVLSLLLELKSDAPEATFHWLEASKTEYRKG
jgi:hypothetical protein